MTRTTASERQAWTGKTFEQVAALCASRSYPLSSPHVLATRAQPSRWELSPDPSGGRSTDLVRYEVLVENDFDPERLTFKLALGFADGSAVKTTATAKPQQVVVIPLENGSTLILQGSVIASRADLERVYQRKRRAADAARAPR